MFENFLKAIRNMFTIPELRKRILFTLGMLAVYRLGSHIRTPNIDPDLLKLHWEQLAGSLLGVLDLFTGGNLRVVSLFALGITPYITASIILQLMTVVWPYLKALQEEGELGRRKITQYTRYLTVVLCTVQSFFIANFLYRAGVVNESVGRTSFYLTTMLVLTTGTTFVMWIGEQITERGVGNGISLLIFAGIVIGLPRGIQQIYGKMNSGLAVTGILLMLASMVGIIMVIVFVERAARRVPIHMARKMAGSQQIPTSQSHLPLKVNMGGVIPVIFAASILAVPQTIAGFVQSEALSSWLSRLHGGHPLYMLIYISAIVFFTFFYVTIIFPVDEVSDNLRKHGQFIPGIRPGKRTADYLNAILTRLTTVGAIYLAVISIIPQVLLNGFNVAALPWIGDWLDSVLRGTPVTAWITTGAGFQFYFGGTSLLIVVGVAMDTVAQIEAQLIMRHYDGFLKGGARIRGRRG